MQLLRVNRTCHYSWRFGWKLTIDDREWETRVVEDGARKLPAIGQGVRPTPVRKRIDVAAGEILPNIVVRIAVVVLQVERVSWSDLALSGVESEDATVGDFIQGMAPGVVELKQQGLRPVDTDAVRPW